MKIGTKSLIFGAHALLVHPFYVAKAWTKLFGFPYDPRLWFAFFLHDIGYLGKPNIDGPEGETHPELGALIMHVLFDWKRKKSLICTPTGVIETHCQPEWANFCLGHSGTYAKLSGNPPSQLYVADKLAFCVEPKWFYKLRVYATGEIHEYMENQRKYCVAKHKKIARNFDQWYEAVAESNIRKSHIWMEDNYDRSN